MKVLIVSGISARVTLLAASRPWPSDCHVITAYRTSTALTVTKFIVPKGVMCTNDFFISKIVVGRYLSKRSDSHLMGTSTSCDQTSVVIDSQQGQHQCA